MALPVLLQSTLSVSQHCQRVVLLGTDFRPDAEFSIVMNSFSSFDNETKIRLSLATPSKYSVLLVETTRSHAVHAVLHLRNQLVLVVSRSRTEYFEGVARERRICA